MIDGFRVRAGAITRPEPDTLITPLCTGAYAGYTPPEKSGETL